MLSDSDNSPIKKRRGKTRQSAVLSSSSDDESDIPVRKRKSTRRVSSSSSSDSGGSAIIQKRKKIRTISESDSDSTSSSSEEFVAFGKWVSERKKKQTRALRSDSSSSGCSKDIKSKNATVSSAQSGSQTSDEESEKCIICFKAFRGVIAHPSGCQHNFHSQCILTWSKTSNTCPIDRVKYTEVIVTDPDGGGIVSRHEVKTPPPQNHGDNIDPDDPTFCEVCHQHDREHEMLLCDRCEAGYHLNCLNPPLAEVPVGDWYCPDCSGLDNAEIDDDEVSELLREGEILSNRFRQRAAPVPRIRPRTRAAQRVIYAIRQMAEQSEWYQPSTSTSRSGGHSGRRRTTTSRRKKRGRSTRSTHYKVEVVTVEDGSTVEVKVAVNSRKSRRKKGKRKSSGRKASSSKRYSCPAGGSESHRSGANNDHHSLQSLDIFGSRPQLDYFSGCEAEDELDEDGGLAVLRARTVSSRGMANRKQMAAQILRTNTPRRPAPVISVSSAPPDLLSSILDEQTKWHSPNTVIQSNSSGEVKVIMKDTSKLPVRRAVAAGEGSTSSGGGEVKPSPKESTGGGGGGSSNGGGGEGQRNGQASSSSSSTIPPLEPPPQPVFSKVYEDEDFDLYADIEPPLAPPPEPPALLLALEGDEAASSPEDAMLVIDDDRQTYDPDVPTSPPPSPDKPEDDKKEKESTIRTPQKSLILPHVDLDSIRLPSPEGDIDHCPNRQMYSAASVELAQSKSDSESDKEDSMDGPMALIKKMNLNTTPKFELSLQKPPFMTSGAKDNKSDKIDSKTSEKDSAEVKVSSSEDNEKTGSKKTAQVVDLSNKYDPEMPGDDEEEEEEEPEDENSDKSQEPSTKTQNSPDSGKEIEKNETTEESKQEEKKIEQEAREEEDAREDKEIKDLETKLEQVELKIEELKDEIRNEGGSIKNEVEDIKNESEEIKNEGEEMKIDEEEIKKKEKDEIKAEDGEMKVEEGEIKSEEEDLKPEEEELKACISEEKTEKEEKTKSDDEDLKPEEGELKDDDEEDLEKTKASEGGTPLKRREDSDEEGEEKSDATTKSTSEEGDKKPASPDSSHERENNFKKKGKVKLKHLESNESLISSSESDDKNKDIDSSSDSTPPRKRTLPKDRDREGEDVLELGCDDEERDGLVDITDEEISTYEKSWELEDKEAPTSKTGGLEGLETEAISDCEYNIGEDGQVVPRVSTENGPKEEGEIISDEVKSKPVAWKKATKAKERSYREKDSTKEKTKKKEKKPKEKRKELERYDVRKIISDKPKKRRVDEFGRDLSSRSRSLSDSKSRSRSLSVKSVRSRRSRSRSRSKRRRSRERRSRNRSRARSRPRVRSRSRRRGRSRSRSRSDSRRRRSRSARRNKQRRSRPKSREKKRRKRDSSMSCSSCSCSSCERERRKTNKKLTVIVPNEPTRSGKEKKKSKYKDRNDLKRRRVDSPVPSKEVFTSGDNILVSVNFKSSKAGEVGRKESSKKKKDDESSKKKKDKSSKENQPLRSIVSKSNQSQRRRINARNLKPVAIIDLAQSPFREQTLSPKEVIVLTDSDSDDKRDKRKNDDNSLQPCQVTGPKTPPEPHIKFNIVSSKPQMLRSLVNPLLDSVDQMEGEGEEEEDERVEIPHKGPNTPPEPPVPYDPFEPTKSRSPTPLQDIEENQNTPTPPGDKILPSEPPQRPVSPPPKPPPETPKTPSPLHSPPKPPDDKPPEKVHISPPNNCNDDSMDMVGGDSPYSPGSTDGEDIEPPLPLLTTPAPLLSKAKARPMQKHMQKLTPSPLKRKPGNKSSTPVKSMKGGKKDSIGLKLDEDQLKILDDLPNSAVEMQVKDKFLKKLNRQERVVEEVKMVLKPHYAKKHVNKEEYKEILRKSVPKICHSRSGEINPMKIQRLIEAYVKKYRHLRRKKKMTNFSGPESSNPLLKPKPKPTMWC